MSFDLIIRNGTIIDGTGKNRHKADIGITGEKIVAVGVISEDAHRYIDASDLIVAPGVIDIHGHSDMTIYENPSGESKIHQGITTEVWGNCGLSFAPFPKKKNPQAMASDSASLLLSRLGLEGKWSSFGEYLKNLPRLGFNVVPLVGYARLWRYVMGSKTTSSSEEELVKMELLLQTCLDEGAFGMSIGLEYPPDFYSTPHELIRMCKILADNNAFYSTHIRNEDARLWEAIDEALTVSKRSGCPVQISHLKLSGQDNRGKSTELLKYLEDAKKNGIDVTWDAYPYTALGTGLIDYIPNWVGANGPEILIERLKDTESRQDIKDEIARDIENKRHPLCAAPWDKIIIAHAPTSDGLEGKSIAEIAECQESDSLDTVFDILADNRGVVKILVHCMDTNDMENILQHPDTIISTDSRAISIKDSRGQGKPHPRYCGVIPRVLRYARETKLFSMEEAIQRMTSLPAKRIGIFDRGRIEIGMAADLMLFNPKTVTDNATYENPIQYPTGIEYVFVNGHLVINKGMHTGILRGKVLKPN